MFKIRNNCFLQLVKKNGMKWLKEWYEVNGRSGEMKIEHRIAMHKFWNWASVTMKNSLKTFSFAPLSKSLWVQCQRNAFCRWFIQKHHFNSFKNKKKGSKTNKKPTSDIIERISLWLTSFLHLFNGWHQMKTKRIPALLHTHHSCTIRCAFTSIAIQWSRWITVQSKPIICLAHFPT